MKKALFLDRDGVINEDVAYAHTPGQITFVDGIFTLCRTAVEKGYRIIVVTNQAGVAKGMFTEEDVKTLHAWMHDEFLKQGITVTAFYYSPYHEEAAVPAYKRKSDCRKPGPGLVQKAAGEHDIDVSRSLMVGDKPSDRIRIKGLRSIIIRSRYTEKNHDYDVETLLDVQQYL